MKNMLLRNETGNDRESIHSLIVTAFENHPYSNHTEHLLVEKLRTAEALALSLVSEIEGKIVGHIAFSPVTIDGKSCGWYGLAPVAVSPYFQGQGIGAMLITAGLAELRNRGAQGCVLLGEPDYYGRFGFMNDKGLTLPGVPPEYFLALPFTHDIVQGQVAYHATFDLFS